MVVSGKCEFKCRFVDHELPASASFFCGLRSNPLLTVPSLGQLVISGDQETNTGLQLVLSTVMSMSLDKEAPAA